MIAIDLPMGGEFLVNRYPMGAIQVDADALLDLDATALTYLNVLRQPRSVWTWEMELRPWVEHF